MELLEFLLRLAEVLFVSVDGPRPLALAPFRGEESVQTVWRESFTLRYSLSDVLVSPPSAVAAAQLAPIASCADVKRPEIVPVIPPLDLRGSCGFLVEKGGRKTKQKDQILTITSEGNTTTR